MVVESQRNRGLGGQGLDALHVDAVIVGWHIVFLETILVPSVLVDVQVHIFRHTVGTHHVQHFHHGRLFYNSLT